MRKRRIKFEPGDREGAGCAVKAPEVLSEKYMSYVKKVYKSIQCSARKARHDNSTISEYENPNSDDGKHYNA